VSSQQLRITLAGSEHVVEAGTTAGAVLGPEPGVIAARVSGGLRDLASPVADGDVVEPVTIASDDGHYILRHSAAHVMAQAVQDLFPQTKLGIGPAVADLEAALEPGAPQSHEGVDGNLLQGLRDEDAASVLEGAPTVVEDPRLSTTHRGDELLRVGLELWLGQEEHEYPLRAAGEVDGSSTRAQESGWSLEASALRCHTRGREGIGVYLLARSS